MMKVASNAEALVVLRGLPQIAQRSVVSFKRFLIANESTVNNRIGIAMVVK